MGKIADAKRAAYEKASTSRADRLIKRIKAGKADNILAKLYGGKRESFTMEQLSKEFMKGKIWKPADKTRVWNAVKGYAGKRIKTIKKEMDAVKDRPDYKMTTGREASYGHKGGRRKKVVASDLDLEGKKAQYDKDIAGIISRLDTMIHDVESPEETQEGPYIKDPETEKAKAARDRRVGQRLGRRAKALGRFSGGGKVKKTYAKGGGIRKPKK